MPVPPVTCLACGNRFSTQLKPEPFDLSNRLRSYERVSSTEESQIYGFLNEIAAETERVDAELERLGGLMDVLRAMRRDLDTKKDRLQSLLAPVRKLPTDVLVEIFQVNAQNVFSNTEHSVPAVVLGKVCLFWHSISLSARLWSNISCASDGLSPSTLGKLLARSKKAPLVISFRAQRSSPKDTVHAHLSLLARESTRWQTAHLSLHTDHLDARIFESIRGNVPILESVEIGLWNRPRAGVDILPKEFLGAFEHAPVLRSVAVDRLPAQYCTFPWRQVEVFSVTSVTDATHVAAISPSLRQLAIAVTQHSSDEQICSATSDSITNLSFDGKFLSHEELKLLMLNLILPSLESATFKDVQLDADSFRKFTFKSSYRLTSLVLENIKITSNDLVPFFEPLSTLQHLRFHDDPHRTRIRTRRPPQNPEADNLLKMMTADAKEPSKIVILPRLTQLNLLVAERGALDGFSDKLFIAMVKSRCAPQAGVVRLNRVRVYLNSQPAPKKLVDPLTKMSTRVRGQKLDIVVIGRTK